MYDALYHHLLNATPHDRARRRSPRAIGQGTSCSARAPMSAITEDGAEATFRAVTCPPSAPMRPESVTNPPPSCLRARPARSRAPCTPMAPRWSAPKPFATLRPAPTSRSETLATCATRRRDDAQRATRRNDARLAANAAERVATDRRGGSRGKPRSPPETRRVSQRPVSWRSLRGGTD